MADYMATHPYHRVWYARMQRLAQCRRRMPRAKQRAPQRLAWQLTLVCVFCVRVCVRLCVCVQLSRRVTNTSSGISVPASSKRVSCGGSLGSGARIPLVIDDLGSSVSSSSWSSSFQTPRGDGREGISTAPVPQHGEDKARNSFEPCMTTNHTGNARTQVLFPQYLRL